MDPTEFFSDNLADLPGTEQIETQEPTDIDLIELFPNFAEKKEITEKLKTKLKTVFSNIQDRGDLEEIWDKNDEMYRVRPDPSKDDEHRANEATGVFHIGVNQLVSMAFKIFTDYDNYKYGFRAILDDVAANEIRSKNAEIMTLLFRKAQSKQHFKRNLKRVLLDIYKNGNGIIGIPWDRKIVSMEYRDKVSGERKSKDIADNNLPGFLFIPLDRVWLDENIDDLEDQPGVFIKSPISWTDLLRDKNSQKVSLFTEDQQGTLRDKFSKFKDHIVSSEYGTPESDRFENADRTQEERTSEMYNHWVIWINLPINKQTQEWDEDGVETRFRVRILGDPENCEIIEIRQNIFPGGMPLLNAHQTEDDIGFYHISLGEKVASYYDQITISVDQLIDNRSKNNRRTIVYDPLRCSADKYDFGHSNGIACVGDPRAALMELQIADMTGNIMNSIQYFEQKVREIMNTTDAVMGMAMGGRTSASEYMGAKVAATTPIFSDMASIEDALIGEYMRRFAQYVHTFMTHEDIISQIGTVGAEFQFDLVDIYTVELKGVVEMMDKAMKIQNLLQLYQMSQDAGAKSKIMLRLAEAMGVDNPAEFVVIPAKDQSVKAALWENNEILVYAQWDEPELGEMHDIHIPIHMQALWQAQRFNSPNVPMMQQHISMTNQLKRQEQSMAGGSFPGSSGFSGNPNQPPANLLAPLPGDIQGQEISGQLGNIQAGSQSPAEQTPLPEGL